MAAVAAGEMRSGFKRLARLAKYETVPGFYRVRILRACEIRAVVQDSAYGMVIHVTASEGTP